MRGEQRPRTAQAWVRALHAADLLPNPDRKVLESLTDFTGTGKVLQTSLSKDSEEALRKVFEAKS